MDVKVCAVSDVWSGLKLVVRRELACNLALFNERGARYEGVPDWARATLAAAAVAGCGGAAFEAGAAWDPKESRFFDDGVDVVRILMSAYLSAEQGKTVAFPPRGLDRFVPDVAQGGKHLPRARVR